MLQIILVINFILVIILMTIKAKRSFSRQWANGLLWLSFILYAAGNLYFTLFSRTPMGKIYFELRPFASYIRMFRDTSNMADNELNGWLAKFFLTASHPIQGIILNILLYVPLGYLLPELFHKLSNKQVLLISFLATFCTELTQLTLKLGWCETDDLIHNMLGAAIGLAIYRWQKKDILGVTNQE